MLFNPKLEIFEPKDGAVLMSARIHIAGRADPNSAVWVAGKIFQSGESGIFEGDIALAPGFLKEISLWRPVTIKSAFW
ncbi:MAG: hypothetical protein UW49_C0002G0079 [Candidatus Giovannonibacteria bacterium GW2011_GWB1_44_23]|uniref:Uncharacterized protein n=1 Tax=Candidatus Giovannonibacteria bacterium GW2011_GWB1_44_23 TaxID=1618652 RepID=A0A0G1IFT8_9BACT|nr:MAG: hypothetical protein UW49_C0002G0079 [Candidatus Giovannonibacteria bacterium GW2011_GWB1_44_23]